MPHLKAHLISGGPLSLLHNKVRGPQGPGKAEVTTMSLDVLCAEPVSQGDTQAAGALRGQSSITGNHLFHVKTSHAGAFQRLLLPSAI